MLADSAAPKLLMPGSGRVALADELFIAIEDEPGARVVLDRGLPDRYVEANNTWVRHCPTLCGRVMGPTAEG